MPRRGGVAGAFLLLSLSATGAHAQGITLEHAASPYDALIERADDAFEARDLDGAIALLEQAVALDETRPEAFNNLGVAELARGAHARAADRFFQLAQLIRRRPAGDAEAAQYHVHAHDGMLEAGGLLLDEGGAADAVPIFEQLIALYPESDDARHNLAVAYYDLGRWQDMLDVGRAMVEHQPLSDAGWSFLTDGWLGLAEETDDDAAYEEYLQRSDDLHAQAEALPVRFDALRLDAGTGALSGRMTGVAAAAGAALTVRFRFHGRDGVLDERVVTLSAPAPGTQATFTAGGPVAPVTGWTYTLVE